MVHVNSQDVTTSWVVQVGEVGEGTSSGEGEEELPTSEEEEEAEEEVVEDWGTVEVAWLALGEEEEVDWAPPEVGVEGEEEDDEGEDDDG